MILTIFPATITIYLLNPRPSSANINVGIFDKVVVEQNTGKYDK